MSNKLDLVSANLFADMGSPAIDLAQGGADKDVRRAKIICTIGPASDSEASMGALLRLGMDVARINFSHGVYEEHARTIERLRRAAKKEGRSLAILQDLQGPKMRTGSLKGHRPVQIEPGSRVVMTGRSVPGTAKLISTTFPNLAAELEPGARVLLSDGRIELRVHAIRGDEIECDVIHGGVLGEHQGINLPGALVRVPSLTEKDRQDLSFGLAHGVDLVALSFVRSASDVAELKQLIAQEGSSVPVIAKLEKPQAIEHLEEILRVTDAVMIARGDLGVELPPERVPVIQKRVIQKAAEWRKPVITATQMLESMIDNPRPTRAEASDVANAIFDGTDAVMLSGETARGRYPREALAMMSRIVIEAERNIEEQGTVRRRKHRRLSIAETICESIAHAAEDLAMSAVAVFTESGNTARLISKYRPKAKIFAFTHFPQVANRMNLLWGVRPVLCRQAYSSEDMVTTAESHLLALGCASPGDVLGIVAGTQFASGSTNFMRLHIVPQDKTKAAPKPRSRHKC